MTATPTERLGDLVHTVPVPVLAAAAGVAVIAIAVLAWRTTRALRGKKAADTLTVVAAAMASSVAATGMWHFFTRTMHLPVWIQAVLFAFMEIAVLASALRARANVAREGHAGADGLAVWVLTCASGFMSATEATSPQEALVRLGAPLVAAWLWERSMVPERRARRAAEGKDTDGVFAKIKRSAKERFLATLGVTAPDLSALEIRQDRALADAVRLADRLAEFDSWFLATARRGRLTRRLRTAVRLSGAASDAARAALLKRELGAVRHAPRLATLVLPSPWNTDSDPEPGNSWNQEPYPSGSTRNATEFQSGTGGTGNVGNHATETVAGNPEPREREQRPGTTDAGNGNAVPQEPAAHAQNDAAGTQEPRSTQEPGTAAGTGDARNPGTGNGSPNRVPAGTGTARNRPMGTVTTLVPKDEQLRIVRELGAGVPLADIRERLGCSKAQASRLRSQVAAETKAAAGAERDEEPEREVVA